MKLSQFKFKLPPELIAERPSDNRDESRLMVLDRKTQTIEHKMFRDIMDYVDDGDTFIINNNCLFLWLSTTGI
jgi:S-adenosylmethionine:tRNA ribosyltransferase-isomerase